MKNSRYYATGIKLILNKDSSFVYIDCSVKRVGEWRCIKDSLYLYCEKSATKSKQGKFGQYNSEKGLDIYAISKNRLEKTFVSHYNGKSYHGYIELEKAEK